MTFIKHCLFIQRGLYSYLKKSWLYTTLGLVSVSFIIIFQDSIEQKIKKDGQALLGADIEVSVRGKPEQSLENYIKLIKAEVDDYQHLIEMNVMLRSGDGGMLVSATGIESEYPFYNQKMNQYFKENITKNTGMVVSKEVAYRLNLQVGDELYLGEKEFQLSDIFEPNNQNFNFGGFLPKAFLKQSVLLQSGLIGELSSEKYHLLIKLKDSSKTKDVLKTLKDNISDSSIRVKSFLDGNNQSTRILDRLNRFISIIALISLIYAFVGCLYSFRQYLSENIPSILVWKTLGYSYSYLRWIWLVKILFISIILFLSVTFIQVVSLFFLNNYFTFLSGIDLKISAYSVFITLILSLIFHFIVYFTYSNNLKAFDGLSLLRGGLLDLKLKTNKWILFFSVFIFYLLSFLLSKSFTISNLFILGILFLILLLWVLFQVLLRILSIFKKIFYVKYVYYIFSRNQVTFLAIFFSLTIGITLSNLIPVLEHNIQKELRVDNKPSLFFFDIQEDQLSEFKKYLSKKYNARLSSISPMIRARLVKINDKEVKDSSFLEIDSAEQESRRRFRNRAFNLSYREGLSEAENIIKGTSLKDYNGQYIPVSLEKRFSDRTNMTIGDVLEFDIMGDSIKAKVVNLRTINWFSFQPNFFVQFGEGVLNDYPKVYLATLNRVNEQKKRAIQFGINKKFNNISGVDLDYVIDRVVDLMNDFTSILKSLSLYSFIIGLLVFFAIYGHFIQSRENEIRQLKILGFTSSKIRKIFMIEILVQFLFCNLLALISVALMSRYLVNQVFLIPWTFVWLDSLLIMLLYAIFMFFTFLYFNKKFFDKSSSDLLRKL